MAERELGKLVERARTLTVTVSLTLIAFLITAGAPAQAAGERVRWTSSIERPSRDWDYDGERILGHIGYDIGLWDAKAGALLHRMKGQQDRIHAVQFSPDGDHAISSSWIRPGPMVPYEPKDISTILWNLKTGQREHHFQGQVAGEFSPDGSRLLMFSRRPDNSTSFDAVVWDVATKSELVKVTLSDGSNPHWTTLHFSPDGRRFAVIDSSAVVLYDSSDGHKIETPAIKYGLHHRYTSNGQLVSFDTTKASRIDLESGRLLQSFEHGVDRIWRGVWTHDGHKAVAIPIDGPIRIWSDKPETMITGAKGGTYPQRIAIISPDNSRLALAWGGAQVEKEIEPELGLYDLDTGKSLAVIKLAKDWKLVGFSPDSKTLLIVGSESAIYNSMSGTRVHTLTMESLGWP